MIDWTIKVGPDIVKIKMIHIEAAVDAGCSVLTKEIAFNDKIKNNPAQRKAYDTHIEVLRLLERIFHEIYNAYEEHQRKKIPGKR